MTVDDVITALNHAKKKLTEAKTTGLQGAAVLARARDSVSYALGSTGRNSPLLAAMTTKHRTLVAQVMTIDALSQRIDQAIAQARSIGDTGNAASDTGSTETPP
jgi:hypothetical protein